MAEHGEPIKDPTRKGFWRWRNMLLLGLTALAPVIGKTSWDWMAGYVEREREMREHVSQLLREVAELKKSQEESVQGRPIWTALSEAREEIYKIRVEHEAGLKYLHWVAQRMGRDMPAVEPRPVEPAKPDPIPKLDAEKYRNEFEKKYPDPKQQPQQPKK